MTKTSIVQQYFQAWERNDRQLLERLLADDFTFTSPYDDAIDKADYWENCWSGCRCIQHYQIEDITELDHAAYVRYVCHLVGGRGFKNAEYFRFEGEKVAEIEVFFGRTVVDDVAPPQDDCLE